jgi:DNA-binding transcriptional ArsR family regulator
MSFEGRRVTEPSALRALSHPLRLRILELLELEGPLTATEAATHLDTTASNLSFHLRLLAKHGYVVDTGDGVGRNRPWRLVDTPVTVKVDDLDEAGRDAIRVFIGAVADRYRANALRWLGMRDRFPKRWRNAASDSHLVLHMSAEELSAVAASIDALLQPYLARGSRRHEPGTAPVSIIVSTLPLAEPTPSTSPAPAPAPSTTTRSKR